MMSVKQLVLDTVRDLPDEISWAELFDSLQSLVAEQEFDAGESSSSEALQQELLASLAALQRGLDDIRAGRVFDARSVIAEFRSELAAESAS